MSQETALSPGDEATLWAALQQGDPAARQSLIAAYLPFARILAAKVYARRIEQDLEFEEYLQFATLGMIEAVDRFDAGLGVLFRTYAAHRISGAIRNGLEHLSEKRQQIATRQRLLEERRQSGLAAEQHSGDVFQQLAEMAIGLALGYMLDDAAAYQHPDAVQPEQLYNASELRQLRERVLKLVAGLPPQEKLVIKYHYLQQQSFTEIADTMQLSKGRISQIHRRALQLLREMNSSINRYDVAW